jgi:hypothetical protein
MVVKLYSTVCSTINCYCRETVGKHETDRDYHANWSMFCEESIFVFTWMEGQRERGGLSLNLSLVDKVTFWSIKSQLKLLV